jgi:hypothetical protein
MLSCAPPRLSANQDSQDDKEAPQCHCVLWIHEEWRHDHVLLKLQTRT